MAYTKTTWADGDVITAEKLNNMENGIAESKSGGGIRFINLSNTDSDGNILYESGLSVRDFMGAFVGVESNRGNFFYTINQGAYNPLRNCINLVSIYDIAGGDPATTNLQVREFQYYPETGIIQASLPD